MPNDPEYNQNYIPGTQGKSYVYGVEYDGPPVIASRKSHNAPCAVCYVPNKTTSLMIPAKTTCPTDWIREYYGYLMGEWLGNYRSEFVCVDSILESVPGSQYHLDGAHFYHVEAHCNGMACPPYNNYKELGCVVCIK